MAVAVTNHPQAECKIVTDFARLEPIASEWQSLWASTVQCEVFQHFGWARACWEAYAPELSLLTPVVYRGDELIGILPLAVRQGTLRFITSPLSDYNDVICREEDTAEVMDAAVQALLRASAKWATCVMENVPAHSRLVRYLAANPGFSRHFRTAFRSPCPTAILSEDGTVATKLAGKQSLRRHENHLKKQGRVTFKHLERREDIDQHLEIMFDQHIARRAIAGGESHFLDPQVRELFQRLVHELDPRSALRFSVLSLDEKPVAYHLGFQHGRKLVIYQLSFDVDYWKSSPGEVLFRHLLFYAREQKMTELDFTRGGEIYKDRFANEVRANFTVYFDHDLSLRRRMRVAIRQADGAARSFMEALRKHPPAYRVARSCGLRWLQFWRTCRNLNATSSGGMTAAATRLRRLIFDRTIACTFIVPKQQLGVFAGPHDPTAEAEQVALSEVAITSALRPELKLPMADIHDRIVSGQRVYLVRQGGEPAQLWAARTEKAPATENELSQTEERLICEQCWRNPTLSSDGLLQPFLKAVADDALDAHLSCEEKSPTCNELRSAGFKLAGRTIRLRLLHWFQPVFNLNT